MALSRTCSPCPSHDHKSHDRSRRANLEAVAEPFVDAVSDLRWRFAVLKSPMRRKPAEVGHDASEHREGSDERFEEFFGAGRIDWSHDRTVDRADARVVRKTKILRYAFVAAVAESWGGVLRVWKTTQ